MKAIRIHEDGGPEVLRYEDVDDPEPTDGQVLVELRAASMNHLDVWIRKGLPSVPKPRTLGADGAGVIAGTDERVVINPGILEGGRMHIIGETRDGTHAELIAVPRDYVHPIPEATCRSRKPPRSRSSSRRHTGCSSRGRSYKKASGC